MTPDNTIDPDKIARCEAAMKELLQEIEDKCGRSSAIFTANMGIGCEISFLASGFNPDWCPTLAEALTKPDTIEANRAEVKMIEDEIATLKQRAASLRKEAAKIQN